MKFLKFSMRKLLKSFGYAARGICKVFCLEQNFKVHTFLGALALLLGWLFHLSPVEWCLVLLVIALVLTMEMLNTAIEKLCDFMEPNPNEHIKIIKDICAGMVLCSAVFALVIGIIIYFPKGILFLIHLRS